MYFKNSNIYYKQIVPHAIKSLISFFLTSDAIVPTPSIPKGQPKR